MNERIKCIFVNGDKECKPKECGAYDDNITLQSIYYVSEGLLSQTQEHFVDPIKALNDIFEDNDLDRIYAEEELLEGQVQSKCVYLNPALLKLVSKDKFKAS